MTTTTTPALSELTARDAIELLQRAVAEKGADYIDPNSAKMSGCRYFDDAAGPCCIVGHAFSYLGVTPERITEAYNGFAHHEVGSRHLFANGAAVEQLDLGLSDAATRVFGEAQAVQDRAETWGEALAAAQKWQVLDA